MRQAGRYLPGTFFKYGMLIPAFCIIHENLTLTFLGFQYFYDGSRSLWQKSHWQKIQKC